MDEYDRSFLSSPLYDYAKGGTSNSSALRAALNETGTAVSALSPRLDRSEEADIIMIEDTSELWRDEEWGAAYLRNDAYLWNETYMWNDAYLWNDAVRDDDPLLDVQSATVLLNDNN